MDARRESGAGILALLVLLAVAAAAGAWNYQQNLAAEQQVYRPFRGYSDADLAAYNTALEQQKSADSKHYEDITSRRAKAQRKAFFDQQVREFERVQQAGKAKQAARAQLAESTTTLKLIAEEQRLRAQERDRLKIFFKRLLTIRG